jgi:formylglycine-generating enzyme required for sulfatase activity/tRNA A-37 threonylcarbamoyl transferase component Bud32
MESEQKIPPDSQKRRDEAVASFFQTLDPDVAAELKAFFATPKPIDRLAEPLRTAPSGPEKVLSFGDYEVLEKLGRGGMGVVYKARDTRLNRIVALKMILSGEHAGEADLRRFRTEAEAIARLQHPNIVQVHEVGEHDAKPFFALEFCAGGSLNRKLDGTPWQPKEAARLVETLARAMQAAHDKKVIHRDLKPANVLLTESGELKISDFGLAKKIDETGQTASGVIVGTPSYMAPEQAGGQSKDIGPAADIYALGAILYELLTGRPPFKAATPLDTVLQVISDEPVPPRRLQSKTPADLETICLKCLQKDPCKRYARASELAADLRRFQAGEAIQARPVARLERAGKWVRRNPLLAAALTAVVVSLLLGTTVAWWWAVQANQALAQEEQARKERALAQVDAVLSADPKAVPALLASLEATRADVLPRLRQLWAAPEEAHAQLQRGRVGLALLPVAPEMVRDWLLIWMLQVEDPREMVLLRDGLKPHGAGLRKKLWAQADDIEAPLDQRFRALVALAAFDEQGAGWSRHAGLAAEQLLGANPLHLGTWVQALRPVRGPLLPSLTKYYHEATLLERREFAARVLADYAAEQPELLADLLLDADEKQFAVIYPKFKDRGAEGLTLLIAEIDKKLPSELPSSHDDREKLAKRQANAAVALLRMNQPVKVWPLLKHSPDLRVRSYLIHRFSPLGAGAQAIVKRLEEETDITIRRALLLSLGEYGEKDFSQADREALLPKLREMYQKDSDPGLHASAEWLLRTWKEEAWLKERNEKWARDKDWREKKVAGIKELVTKDKEKGPPQWYVNGQGQTLVVIPAWEPFLMGSPPTEAGRVGDETQHKRRIGRTFSIGAKPVTVAEYRKFWASYGIGDIDGQARTPDSPVIRTSWYQAAVYCNWLSKEEGIAEDQWCYEIKGNVMKLKEKYLSLTGYRLPTEAEMEYATRAGALTSRYYGETDELLAKHAWYNKNSQERTWPVGNLKPNDLGLFDMQGNVFTWCQDSYKPYPAGKGEEAAEDQEDGLVVNSTVSRVLRGGSVIRVGALVRSARRLSEPPTNRSYTVGFRLARTFTP